MAPHRISKTIAAGAAFAALLVMGTMIISQPGRADNDNNGAQDEKQMIAIGHAAAPVPLNMARKDPDMVGLGSYLVNVASDCNGCHSNPSNAFTAIGNPYFLMPPNGPFLGRKVVDPVYYLGGSRNFGSLGPPPSPNIISRNLTPDKMGLAAGQAEGHNTLAQFIQIMRTGADLDQAHPNCSATITTNCFPHGPGLPPFNGELLQVMPWPAFQSMTDRQLTAIYTYLSAIPCLEGGPGEPAHRCQ
jgi:hypothetical protein